MSLSNQTIGSSIKLFGNLNPKDWLKLGAIVLGVLVLSFIGFKIIKLLKYIFSNRKEDKE